MVADVTTNVAWFFLITALSGWALYGLANIRKSRAEIGSEIKLAANRKPYYDDETLEGPRLERVQLWGVILLAAYVIGLCGTLLIVALLGQRALKKLGWLADPHGWFRRGLGIVFIVVGVFVATGLDRDLQAWVIENSPIRPWELDSGFIPTDA